jgi:hypothetical protein
MIEARQSAEHEDYLVYDGDTLICIVATIRREYGSSKNRYSGPDWPATKARAEHIAEALRHYQASQEGEKVL